MNARILVNRFKLPTVQIRIDEKNPKIARFETDVVFNRDTENRIDVEIFRAEGRIASEVGCMKTLVVDCAAPERRQELYVLLLGTGDLQEMRDRARTSILEEGGLNARPLTKQRASVQEWTSEGFSQIHVHDALNAPPAAVQNQVRELVGRMQSNIRKGDRGNPQAIVMIYFQGQITLEKDDFAFGTVDPKNPRARLITGRFLEESLSRSYGAHLIFLDLHQRDQSVESRDVWPKAPHLGIFVANWTGLPGSQPEKARLGSALEQILPRARMVRDVAMQINERYDLAAKEFPGQVETVRRLDDVYGLQFGNAGGE